MHRLQVELVSQPRIAPVYGPRWTWPLLLSKLTPITLSTQVVQVPVAKDAPEQMRTFIVGEAKELGGVQGQITLRVKDWTGRGYAPSGPAVHRLLLSRRLHVCFFFCIHPCVFVPQDASNMAISQASQLHRARVVRASPMARRQGQPDGASSSLTKLASPMRLSQAILGSTPVGPRVNAR